MGTIKSHTDLSQSKTLSKILPLESADMHYNNGSCRGVDYIEHFSAEPMPYQEALHLMKIHKTNFMFQVIPCWSLAALLGVIPNYELISKHNYHTCIAETSFGKETVAWFNNPVDACYEMILKLHKKMLWL